MNFVHVARGKRQQAPASSDPGTVISILPVGAYETSLAPNECQSIQKAVVSRRREFATGRFLARQLMQHLGYGHVPIPRGQDRAPVWPSGMVGSISHCKHFAAVIISTALRGVGIDIECTCRIPPASFDMLFTTQEKKQRFCEPVPTALFSAKEAAYKAIYPLTNTVVEFQEAEIDLDVMAGRFRANYIGTNRISSLMNETRGRLLCFDNHVLTIAALEN